MDDEKGSDFRLGFQGLLDIVSNTMDAKTGAERILGIAKSGDLDLSNELYFYGSSNFITTYWHLRSCSLKIIGWDTVFEGKSDDESIEHLVDLVASCLKIFWDGANSLYQKAGISLDLFFDSHDESICLSEGLELHFPKLEERPYGAYFLHVLLRLSDFKGLYESSRRPKSYFDDSDKANSSLKSTIDAAGVLSSANMSFNAGSLLLPVSTTVLLRNALEKEKVALNNMRASRDSAKKQALTLQQEMIARQKQSSLAKSKAGSTPNTRYQLFWRHMESHVESISSNESVSNVAQLLREIEESFSRSSCAGDIPIDNDNKRKKLIGLLNARNLR